ncbi:MAG: hypothetical protein K2X90_02880 [Candidatus Babeliaceae bacterium]|nr:hypothetical protein [Candidatus Babeliaceae bacterium]
MTHWGWYWGIKRKGYKAKKLCTWFDVIDSFDIFNIRLMTDFLAHSATRTLLEIPRYDLKVTLLDDNSLQAVYSGGSYNISTERKTCNFGGFYTFFRCPDCSKRMRKLYCLNGKYLCRKCANLCYKTQRLYLSRRLYHMQTKTEDILKNKGGSLYDKPYRMHESTFQRIKRKRIDYEIKGEDASRAELREWYGSKIEPYLD